MDATGHIIRGEGTAFPCVGLTSDALPEIQTSSTMNSHTGVSTKNALSITTSKTIKRKLNDEPHWYALRVTYGREKKACDYLDGKHVSVFYPTVTTVKVIDGKRKSVKVSRIPNIFFARGTEEVIK